MDLGNGEGIQVSKRLFDTDEWDLKPVNKTLSKTYLKRAKVQFEQPVCILSDFFLKMSLGRHILQVYMWIGDILAKHRDKIFPGVTIATVAIVVAYWLNSAREPDKIQPQVTPSTSPPIQPTEADIGKGAGNVLIRDTSEPDGCWTAGWVAYFNPGERTPYTRSLCLGNNRWEVLREDGTVVIFDSSDTLK